MTSERSYKKTMNEEDAISELMRCSGTHFDPEIVKVFLNQVLPYSSEFKGEQKDISV